MEPDGCPAGQLCGLCLDLRLPPQAAPQRQRQLQPGGIHHCPPPGARVHAGCVRRLSVRVRLAAVWLGCEGAGRGICFAFWCVARAVPPRRVLVYWSVAWRGKVLAALGRTRARRHGGAPLWPLPSATPPRHHPPTPRPLAPPTRRHTAGGALRIGWSFFAGALGAWVISSPPSYTGSGFGYGAGAIGLAFYSLSSGLPVIMIAFAGDLIRVRRLWSAAAAAAAAAAAGATVVAAAASAAGPATMLRHGLAAAPLPLVATVRTSPCHSLIATSRCVSSSAAQGAPRAVPHRLYGVAVRLGGQDLRCHPLPAQHVHWWVPPLRRPPPPPLWPPLLLLLLRHCCPSAAAPPAAAPVCCSLLSAAATAVAQHLCRPIPTDVYFHLPLCSHPG